MDNQYTRDLVASRITPGSPVIFAPGQELRCPGIRQLSGGSRVPCLFSLRLFAKSKIIVRPRRENSVRISGGTEFHCKNCKTISDVYQVREEILNAG